MLVLRVGDPHAKVSNLNELEKLMQFVVDTALKLKVRRIELLGDLFHTHAVLRIEVLEFWDRWLAKLAIDYAGHFDVVALVGNHDQTGDYSLNSHALSVLKRIESGTLHIVDSPIYDGVFAYMPYYHNADEFIAAANDLFTRGARVLVCHQTFSGSTFENGFYAPDGINPDLLNYDLVISGHIHARQRFGKVIYPGTARWDSNSDANQPKGLWIVEHDDTTGAIIKEEFVDTAQVVAPIFSVEWKEGDGAPALLTFPGDAKITVELVGSSNWVSQRKAELKNKFSLKSKITDTEKARIRQSGANLRDFISNLFETKMDRQRLFDYMKEMGLE